MNLLIQFRVNSSSLFLVLALVGAALFICPKQADAEPGPARLFSIAREDLKVSRDVTISRSGAIDTNYSSAHSGRAQHNQTTFEVAAFEMPLPGSNHSARMQIVGGVSQIRNVPVVQFDGSVREVAVEIMNITDSMSLYGVMARSDAGVFATISDRSSDDKFYQVQPYGKLTKGAEQPHVVEEVKVTSRNQLSSCGDLKLPQALLSAPTKHRQTDTLAYVNHDDKSQPLDIGESRWRAVELFTVLPTEFALNHSDEYLVASVLNTVAGANLFFEQLELQIQVAGIKIHRNPASDPYALWSSRQDALGMLETVRKEAIGGAISGISYDAVAVLGRGEYGGVYGYAYPKTSCIARDWAVLFATQGGNDRASEVSLSATLAHELGHILGMSHDHFNPRDIHGPYLMEAAFVANPSGFSAASMASYQFHAGIGAVGGSCFHSILAPLESVGSSDSDRLSFAGGQEEWIEIREGEVYRTPIVVAPARTQVKYSAIKLPRGATLNSFTGVLSFAPGATAVVGRRGYQQYEALVQVHSKSSAAIKRFVFHVIDTNRAPVVRTRLRGNAVKVRAGKRMRLSFRAVDPDAGDRVQMLFGSKRLLSRLKGKQQIRARGSYLEFFWTPPRKLRGRYVLSFVARDQAGQASRRLVHVHVVR